MIPATSSRTIRKLVALLVAFPLSWNLSLGKTRERHKESDLTLAGIRLGEKLEKFKARFPGVHCHRRSTGATEKQELRKDWLKWIDCVVDGGQVQDQDPTHAAIPGDTGVDVFATFLHEKLARIEYVINDGSMDAIVDSLIRQFGPPDPGRDPALSGSRFTAWSRPHCRLEVDEAGVIGRIDDKGRLCIEKVPPRTAVTIRLVAVDAVEAESESPSSIAARGPR